MNASEYIEHLLSVEEYAFSWEELKKETGKSGLALKSELVRLIEKREILNLRKGFFMIIPPRYSKVGKLPIQLYVHKLFQYLDREYYLGLYTAARFHGASHQQAQRDYVIIQAPKFRRIQKESIDIEFLTISQWPEQNLLSKRSDAGVFLISSPVLTFCDLVQAHPKIGGLNRMLATLEELIEEWSEQDLQDLLAWYPRKSTLQRVGYLLEALGGESPFATILYEHLQQAPFYPILLSPKRGQKPGSVDNRWKVDVNLKLESDL